MELQAHFHSRKMLSMTYFFLGNHKNHKIIWLCKWANFKLAWKDSHESTWRVALPAENLALGLQALPHALERRQSACSMFRKCNPMIADIATVSWWLVHCCSTRLSVGMIKTKSQWYMIYKDHLDRQLTRWWWTCSLWRWLRARFLIQRIYFWFVRDLWHCRKISWFICHFFL